MFRKLVIPAFVLILAGCSTPKTAPYIDSVIGETEIKQIEEVNMKEKESHYVKLAHPNN